MMHPKLTHLPNGMVMDFGCFDAQVTTITGLLDHRYLCDVKGLGDAVTGGRGYVSRRPGWRWWRRFVPSRLKWLDRLRASRRVGPRIRTS